MRSINKVVLIGNLTRDPEMRQTPNGQNVVTFGIATNREWVTNDGRKQSSTEFHDLVAWARLADICHQYLKKGKLVYVEGYLKTRSWDTPEGVKKFRTEIVVQDMIMLDKRGNAEAMAETIDAESDYYLEDETSSEEASQTPEMATASDSEAESDKPEISKEEKEKSPSAAQDRPAKSLANKKVDKEEANPKAKTDDADEKESEKSEEKEPAAAGKVDIDSDLGL